jgi:hypothetical protein
MSWLTGQEAWKDGFSAIQLRKVGNRCCGSFSAYYRNFEVLFTQFSKIKSQKEVIKQQELKVYFCLVIERSGAGSLGYL